MTHKRDIKLRNEENKNIKRKLQNSDITSKDESLCNAIDNALNILKEVNLVLRYGQRDHWILLEKVWL